MRRKAKLVARNAVHPDIQGVQELSTATLLDQSAFSSELVSQNIRSEWDKVNEGSKRAEQGSKSEGAYVFPLKLENRAPNRARRGIWIPNLWGSHAGARRCRPTNGYLREMTAELSQCADDCTPAKEQMSPLCPICLLLLH